ncbi:MAG: protein tyrosine phosphatase family protein [Cocleimonas sp.]
MPINTILNTIIINDNIGTSGQPTPTQFLDIADADYRTVINLAMPDSDNALPEEGSFVTELGMNYFHIPVPFDAPTAEHLLLFFKLMKTVKNEKVWVHCALNMRVSAFMQHYQKSILKLDEADCIPILKNWKPDKIWQDFLKIQ